MTISAIGFATPWLLGALILLPILWLILRAVPPAPLRRFFPGVTLLLGLRDDDSASDRTPWWLLLLRVLAVAAVIIGLAGPVLNPEQTTDSGDGPLLILADASWASAPDWVARREVMDGLLTKAGREGRTAAVVLLSQPSEVVFQSADIARSQLAGFEPSPWLLGKARADDLISKLPEEPFETYWLSDGLADEARTGLIAALERHGTLTVYQNGRASVGLLPVRFEDGAVQISAVRSSAPLLREIEVQAVGRDPAGIERVLATLPMMFEAGEARAEGALSLPAELRGRISRFQIKGVQSAGALTLSDDSLRRREVALIAEREGREGLELLSPLHYLDRAFAPTADILDGALEDVLPAKPDVIVLADVATLSGGETSAVIDWVEQGGLLLRFAGPKMAASEISRDSEDSLMPVRLRAGGRTVGGAMSWGAPKTLAPFPKDSPFFGLSQLDDVAISAQVVAQPDPTLAARVIAELSDGTPLVTRKRMGQGQVILFHVTANAEWSNLPLSGLFVQMLERLAISSSAQAPALEEMIGTTWQPLQVLDGFGTLNDASVLAGVDGEALISDALGVALQPGLYEGNERNLARNVFSTDAELAVAIWPSNITIEGPAPRAETPLAGWLLAAALVLFFADILASLALSGRLLGARAAGMFLIGVLALGAAPQSAEAQSETRAVDATAQLVLAHIITGDSEVDKIAQAGLLGLSETLFFRTSVEPSNPMGINLEADELAFFPLLYWPITPDQPTPSKEAYAKLNRYLRSGGMILFDTRDADVAGFGSASPNGRKLQQLAAPLDIPAIEPIPSDHVLTRTFYLLQDYPGRYTSREVWVEAAPPGAEKVEGMPFRNLNDGVTPVVIGGNDWAASWAISPSGAPMFPVGRGLSGERQRELAYRFGVNLVMHVLTGNYKSDQVHVPALLDRLGQ